MALFFLPYLILVAVSGGLYLVGLKGEIVTQNLNNIRIQDSSNLESEVSKILKNYDYEFEYLKMRGKSFETRPSHRTNYKFKWVAENEYQVIRQVPSFQKSMIELHKGHGPKNFKLLGKIFALGLLLITFSGLFLSLTLLKREKIFVLLMGSGSLLFFFLIFM